jgi:predicted DCC family thiol-disulfide oxidoreductase YuxK
LDATADKNYNVFSRAYWVGGLDLRPLGLFRILFGFLATVSIVDMWPILHDLLSDEGAMPRAALLGIVRLNRFSLFDLAGPYWVTLLLWLLTIAACVCLTLGWHSRLSTVAAFLLVTGIHERNLIAFDGADNVIRVMLFWMMFMPSGARYSVDAVLRAARGEAAITHSLAFPMRLGQLQIAWVYLNSFIHKWGPGTHWRDGTAAHYSFGLDRLFTRDLGQWLYDKSWAYVPATYFTLAVEGTFLILVFFPFLQPKLKAVALAGGTALHAGIWATLNIGNFSYLMPLAYTLLFEPEWAEWVIGRMRWVTGKGVTRVYYDGFCPLCRDTMATLRALDHFSSLSFVNFREAGALAGSPGLDAAELEKRMHTVSEDGKILSGFPAAMLVARRVPALWIFGVLGWELGDIGRAIYDRVAALRQLDHRCDDAACPAPVPPPRRGWRELFLPRQRAWVLPKLQAVLAVLMLGCFWFALPTDGTLLVPKSFPAPLGGKSYKVPKMPDWYHDVVQELELWQTWDMFAPNPMDSDLWLKGMGELKDGTRVDVLHGLGGGPLPDPRHGFFFSRWTKYVNNLVYAERPTLLEFGRFICRDWNDHKPEDRSLLDTFKLYRMQRHTAPPHVQPEDYEEVKIWEHHCF